MLLRAENVEKIYQGEPIFSKVCVSVEPKEKIGIVGANGTGKTTLLSILSGEISADSGTVATRRGLRLGCLKQTDALSPNNTLMEELLAAFDDLHEIEARMNALTKEMEQDADNPDLAEEYAALSTRFEQSGGYDIEVKIAQVRQGMGFAHLPDDFPVSSLSGGEKTRLAMAKLLLTEPELLILDEPTNHLDLQTLGWLEGYLQNLSSAMLLVSHDRYFLDRCVNRIWEISNRRVLTYRGNYTNYLSQKDLNTRTQEKAYQKQQKEIADMEDFIARNLVRASTTKAAQSRRTALEKMEKIERPHETVSDPHIHFTYLQEPVRAVLSVEHLNLIAGEKPLASDLSFDVERGEKLGIIGGNGAGKSTLLKVLQGIMPRTGGKVRWGSGVKIGYYDQEGAQLHPHATVLEEFWQRHRGMTELQVRSKLGAVSLSGEAVYKQVSELSGGERARLGFALLMEERPNVLLLDEPTNHIDLHTKEILGKALAEYTGTLLLVSHDRYILNQVATRIAAFSNGKVTFYEGNYDDYAAKQVAVEAEKPAPPKPVKEKTGGGKTKEQKREEANRRNRFAALERRIAECETEMEQCRTQMQEPEIAADYVKLSELSAKLAQLDIEYNAALEEWSEF